jgi:hypothetical protein
VNAPPDWRKLLRIALDQIDAVSHALPTQLAWSLGGGTALAIHLDHRVSHDIDIFLTDPQVLPYFSPDLADWRTELLPEDERAMAQSSGS